jgi:hypothetical protein
LVPFGVSYSLKIEVNTVQKFASLCQQLFGGYQLMSAICGGAWCSGRNDDTMQRIANHPAQGMKEEALWRKGRPGE